VYTPAHIYLCTYIVRDVLLLPVRTHEAATLAERAGAEFDPNGFDYACQFQRGKLIVIGTHSRSPSEITYIAMRTVLTLLSCERV
jgi:hypothetical protein